MNIVEFTWSTAFAGGLLIGFAAVVLMVTNGKIAGVSGIASSILSPTSALPWQWAFIAGLLASGFMVHFLFSPISIEIEANTAMLIVAGLLVGFGTRLGNGCTSGHGVCGISRLSPRSLVATAVFISMGMLTVFMMSLIGGGA
jgi:uncharacterized membrane protein YedE/YeeE